METIGFRITMTLATPAIVSSLTTLDSILSRVLYDRAESTSVAELPIAQRDGCWCASSLQFGRGYWHQATQIARLSGTDWDPCRYSSRDSLGNPKFLVAGGLYAPRLDSRRAWIGLISFQAQGNPEIVERLLEDLPGLGAKTAQGFGEIARIRIDIDDTDGLMRNGYPLRPIPVRLWEQWGQSLHEGIALDAVPWHAPYWGLADELCVVPNW